MSKRKTKPQWYRVEILNGILKQYIVSIFTPHEVQKYVFKKTFRTVLAKGNKATEEEIFLPLDNPQASPFLMEKQKKGEYYDFLVWSTCEGNALNCVIEYCNRMRNILDKE